MSAGSAGSAGELRFGATEVPAAERDALRRAVRLEWVTMAYMVTCVVLVYLVMGSSQAMKAAWIEDLLAFIPPIAFLIATRVVRRPPDADFPHGRHRAVAGGHLAAAVALLTVGLLLIVDSASGLLAAEHPPIGTTRILGHTLWAGWPMIAVMVYTAIGPVLIARAKMPLAEQLHDRILFADADMQKADWMTATGSIAGILGIGLGLWWADSVVAIAIAGSIVHDGWRNLRHAIRGLMDARAHHGHDRGAPAGGARAAHGRGVPGRRSGTHAGARRRPPPRRRRPRRRRGCGTHPGADPGHRRRPARARLEDRRRGAHAGPGAARRARSPGGPRRAVAEPSWDP